MLKTSNKAKIIQDVLSAQLNTKISIFWFRNWPKNKKVFKYGYHGYKNNDMLYLSTSAR